MTTRIAIVEDVPSEASLLQYYIETYCNQESIPFEVDIYTGSRDYLAHAAQSYDILFLDIEFSPNEENGMELAHTIRRKDEKCRIVFVTNLGKFAIEGYQVNALDFILKPLNYESFRFRFASIVHQLQNVEGEAIVVKSKGAYHKVLAQDIYYVCIINHICYFYGVFHDKDLAFRMGQLVGESGLLGDVGGNDLPYTCWYAPAVNIHRSPFAGRNYEYYSEDPIVSGKMAVNVVNGAASKGVVSDLKHFALNDQETNRSGVATFCTEQALREIYLKPFELAVKGKDSPTYSAKATADGITKFKGTQGIMSSFNRIGVKWTGGDYRLLTKILRNEWGFAGLVICDYKTDNTVMDSRQMVYAGNDLILTTLDNLRWTDSSASSAKDVYVLRTAAHNILYAIANSNSVNVRIIGYNLETWVQVMIWVDVAIAVVIAGLGVLGSVRAGKRKED